MSARGFYSIAELAELAGVEHKAVRRAIDRGELRAEKLFNRLRVSAEEWERYRALHVRGGRAPEAPPRAVARRRPSTVTGSLARLRAIEGGE